MHKQNFLTISLIVTGLALNPVMGESELRTVTKSINVHHTLISGISSVLHKRGLDADAADALAVNLVSEEDEIFLAMLIEKLEAENIVHKSDVLAFLSDVALHRQTFDFHSYDQLIGMVSKIKQKPLDDKTLAQLRLITKQKTSMLA